MKTRAKMSAAKLQPGSPSPFLLVVANNKDANEWTETEVEYYAYIYPLMSKPEAVAMMNEVIAGGAVVARIFRYDHKAGTYLIDDEWTGSEIRSWQS